MGHPGDRHDRSVGAACVGQRGGPQAAVARSAAEPTPTPLGPPPCWAPAQLPPLHAAGATVRPGSTRLPAVRSPCAGCAASLPTWQLGTQRSQVGGSRLAIKCKRPGHSAAQLQCRADCRQASQQGRAEANSKCEGSWQGGCHSCAPSVCNQRWVAPLPSRPFASPGCGTAHRRRGRQSRAAAPTALHSHPRSAAGQTAGPPMGSRDGCQSSHGERTHAGL